jgi:Uma2 family endonuclease
MVGMGHAQPTFSLADFLAWEESQLERHEFVCGEVFAVVGARRVHGLVSLNIAAALKSQLRGSPCRAFHETMKLQVADEVLFYPDVFVTCDPADLRTERIFTTPTVVVEVLSPSTQSYDRGQKFTWYRRLVSLREYLLVDPDTRELQLFRRGAEGLFTLHDLTGMPQVELTSIGCVLPAEEIFDGLDPEVQGALPGI